MTSDTPEHREGPSGPDPEPPAEAGVPAGGFPTPANGTAAPRAAGDVTALLRAGLRTAADELERTNELRAEMARVLSTNLLAMAAAPDPAQAGEKIATMIAALQNDDRIRQRIEGLAGSLLVMLRAMEEAAGAPCGAGGGPGVAAPPIGADWAQALVDSQCLDELAESFGAGLAASGDPG